MKRSMVVVLGMVFLLVGCFWPFGETFRTVAFTVMDTAGSGLDTLIPKANIVHIDEQTVDILITGGALKNGPFPLLVNNVKADDEEIQIILDWEKSAESSEQPVHKLIRLEKGDWFQSKKRPRIRLMNVNGGELMAASKPRDVRQMVLDKLPELIDEQVYLKFAFEDMAGSDSKGVWEATVIGTPEKGDGSLDVVAKLRLDDQQLKVISGRITTHSSHNGTVVKVEELGSDE